MSKSLRCLLSLALLACSFCGWAQRPIWTRVANKSVLSSTFFGSISATDSRGNTYTWQTIAGPTTIGSAHLTTTPNTINPQTGEVTAWNQDVCLAKFKANGQLAWVRQGGGTYTNQAAGLAIDERGNIFVSGFNWQNFHFGAHTSATEGYFLSRVDSAGTVQWVQHLADYPYVLNKNFQAPQLQADGQGNCYLLGYSRNNTTFSSQPLVVTDHYDAFLAKCNTAGQYQWVRQLFSTTPYSGSPAITAQLAADAAGNCTVAGNFTDTLTIGTGGPRLVTTPVNFSSPRNTFVVRFDRDGQLRWTRQGNSTYVSGTAMDSWGNTYVGGYASGGPTHFGTLTTLAGGSFVLKYDPAGKEQWLRGTGAGYVSGVQVDADGNVYLGGRRDNAMTIGAYTLPPATGGYFDGFLLSYAPDGSARWLYGFGGPGSNDNAGRVGIDAKQNLYVTLSSDSLTYLGGQAVAGSRNATVLARFTQRANRLAGIVYLDQNANGRRDTTEVIFPRAVVLTDTVSGQLFTSDSERTGRFQAFTDTGAWAVRPARLPAYYTLSQPTAGRYAGHFATYGQVADTLNFGLRPVANRVDLRLTLTAYGPTRPGFLTYYRLSLENAGTTVIPAGAATLTLDARVQYSSSSSPTASVNGRVVSWSYPALAPLEHRSLDVTAKVLTTAPVGTTLTTAAAALVTADLFPTDNVASAYQVITGSLDPNSLEVNYQQLTTAQVAAGQPLDYTIHFQNVGTDTAFVVVLTDTLSNKLDLSSLQLVAQSHPCNWRLTEGGLLTVRFPAIHLPHIGRDSLRSQGFVRFRVLPRLTLTAGQVIPNHAHIFFDYNAPVRTNTATTTVLLPTALVSHHPQAAWDTYPNPAGKLLTVAADLTTGGTVQLELLDLLGRSVQRHSVKAGAGAFRQVLDLSAATPGLYVLRLRLPSGQVSSRQVVHQ